MYEQPYNPYLRNVSIIKDFFKSKKILVLAILNIASVILSIVNNIVSADLSKEITEKLIQYYDNYIVVGKGNTLTTISDALHSSTGASGGFSISLSLAPILTIAALLIIYIKSRDEKPESSPSAGFTILYILAIFALIGVVLLALVLIALTAFLFILYAEMKNTTKLDFDIKFADAKPVRFDSNVMLILAIVGAALSVIVIAVSLFYAINRFRYLGSVRKSMSSVELSRKGAKPYGIYCIIVAAFSIVSMLSSVPMIFANKSDMFAQLGFTITSNTVIPSLFSILTQAASAAIWIVQAKIAIDYAKYIDNQKFGYNEPSEPAAYAPANVGVGSSNTQTPYSYLAQPQTSEQPKDDAAFTNPYQTPSAQQPADKQVTCPNCGAATDGSAPFCGQCGTKLP